MLKSSRLTRSFSEEACVFCRDEINGIVFRAPCGHCWDIDCLVNLFRAASTDESLFPPRCCQKPFAVNDIKPYLGQELSAVFEKKSIEFSTADRIYCHRPTCSFFLGPATAKAIIHICRECYSQTCGLCKQEAHPSKLCPSDDASVLALAEKAGWKRCPGCRALVELVYGCYHMTCRCRKQFCYVCAATWKNCTCPQWDENRLLVAAQRQVQRERPAGPPLAPQQVRWRVAEVAERLRVDHDCQHAWKYTPGAGQCENCFHHLGVFLLVSHVDHHNRMYFAAHAELRGAATVT